VVLDEEEMVVNIGKVELHLFIRWVLLVVLIQEEEVEVLKGICRRIKKDSLVEKEL